MKKLINHPDRVVDDMVDGYAAACPQYIRRLAGSKRALVRTELQKGKVGIVIGGGAGHEPGFMGYVGKGFADGVAVGNIFASPSPEPIVEVTKAVDQGEGVLYIYGNYAGDCMNFDMSAELASLEDIRTATVRVTDDVASAPAEQTDKRRGIAGFVLLFKVAGASAEQGYSLDDVVKVCTKANANTRTMGVALSPCTLPQTRKQAFELADDEMEIGLGIHGEPGMERGKLETADEVTVRLLESIVSDLKLAGGERVAVLVNGLGSTTLMELYIVFRKTAEFFAGLGVKIHRSYVGEYVTSMEMGGCSITVMKLDDELASLIDHPADCPAFTQV
ncbi:dihydroxyacetone kinase subunit DhaK [Paenibacillus thalictri]|uniref:Dihydroxyacetone kinase subunit DhaK n=1 Tax=Paenibacillus thalictri TaxID=2527873 RepID=A0A4Q9DZ57_9BACL|nr:dihydroxyacetone kinase subunit DhaK [Paenibacillus thalictri]TBL81133.1 dihydroxyacetone kinase subunit DhaK [Paenibacillus thalictri]